MTEQETEVCLDLGGVKGGRGRFGDGYNVSNNCKQNRGITLCARIVANA